jgi:hypothetical protein
VFVETGERYEKRHNLIVSLPEGDVVRPPRESEKIVVKAAEWIDDNPPPHVTDSNGLQYGMSMGAQRFCSFGSSFVHGYKWTRDYVAGKRDISAQISDRPAAAAPPGEPRFITERLGTRHAAEFDKPRRPRRHSIETCPSSLRSRS